MLRDDGDGAAQVERLEVRLKADYETEALSQSTGERALTLAQEFVDAVRQRVGGEV